MNITNTGQAARLQEILERMQDAQAMHRDMLVAAIVIVCLIVVCVLVHEWRKNPFSYPYFQRSIDVSRRRNVDIEHEIADWLYRDANWREVEEHEALVRDWERRSLAKAQTSPWKRHRQSQLRRADDFARGYTFSTTRQQTRYRQRNHRRHAYQVPVTDEVRSMGFADVERLRRQALGYGGVTEEFVRRERAKMTPAVRRAVAERDNYTCQMCGKYMPDGVGLQIDHIVPVSKGGRTEMGNLQVLCSKCNAKKSNR